MAITVAAAITVAVAVGMTVAVAVAVAVVLTGKTQIKEMASFSHSEMSKITKKDRILMNTSRRQSNRKVSATTRFAREDGWKAFMRVSSGKISQRPLN